MSSTHRLLVTIGVACTIGLFGALAPVASGQPNACVAGTPMLHGCSAATNNPAWIAGIVIALVAFALLQVLYALDGRRRSAHATS